VAGAVTIDFGSNQIVVRGGKGDKDRTTMLPTMANADLAGHLGAVRAQHRRDLATGAGWVELPTAFGYRIDYAGRSVVLSGDTRVSENLIRHAQGVDLLVHEVASPETFQRAGSPPERAKSVVAHHVTPEQAGEVFLRTKPKLAVYSHIVLPTATEQDLIPPTRKTYAGPLELGEDLMVMEVGEKVVVRRPAGP
jgi:ribonuclease BN (tRNA processing enzyme)